MSIVNKTKSVIALGAFCLIPASMAWAEPSYEFGLGIPYFKFESGFELDDELGLRGLAGLRTGRLQFELNFDTVGAQTEAGPEMDIEQLYGNVLFFGETIGKLDPFLSAGFGQANFTADSVDYEEQTTVANIGAGFKYYVSDNFAIRPSINYFFPTEFDDSYATFGVTFSYLTGGKTKAAPVTAKAPEPAKPADADSDGVLDANDQCLNTPAGILVNELGCPDDSDGDGIYDYQDNCPKSEANVKVDEKGCPVKLEKTVEIELKVNFDSNSDVVKPQYYPEIERVAKFLAEYSGTSVVIEGHTDTMGAASYNKSLSQKRADAVARVLTSRFDVEASKVSAIGYGEERPIADESTREGLVANRRVVAKVSTKVEALQAN